MPASDHISKQLFHGSSHLFNVGDTVEPTGKTETAWATPDLVAAKFYSANAAQDAGMLFAPVSPVEAVDPEESIEGVTSRGNGTNVDPKMWSETGETQHSVISHKGFRVSGDPVAWGVNPDAHVFEPGDRMFDHKGRRYDSPGYDPYRMEEG